MRLLVLVFLLLPILTYAQDCPKGSDFDFQIINPCGESKGSIQVEINGVDNNWTADNFGLYRVDLNDFERNRIDNRGLEIKAKKIIYSDIEAGEYKIALYFYSCSDYPKPILIPNEPITIKVEEDCN